MTTRNVYLIRPNNGGDSLVVASGDDLVSYLDRCKCAATVEQIEMYEGVTSRNSSFFESIFEVCWRIAPSWAKYHAYDFDGQGYFYENMPTLNRWVWYTNGSGSYYKSGLVNINVNAGNFKESLTTRPVTK